MLCQLKRSLGLAPVVEWRGELNFGARAEDTSAWMIGADVWGHQPRKL